MKKRYFKRISAIVLAMVMVLGMSVAAFAAETPTSGGTADVPPAKHISENSFTIEKDIVLFNTETSQIYEPNITYTYSIAPATVAVGTTVTGLIDETGATTTTTVAVRSGVAGGVTIQGNDGTAAGATANLKFGADTLVASNTEGATVTTTSAHVDENLTITIVPATIYAEGANTAGIYRYVLTDTTTAATLAAAGVARDANYRTTLYLDVYMKYNAANNGLEPYGYVLHKGDQNLDFNYVSGSTENNKLSGFDVESEKAANGTTIISDQYHTYNLKVTKTTAGSLADKTHEFPVSVAFANATVTSQADFYSTGDFANTRLSLSNTGAYSVNADFSATPSVKNNDTFTFVGLPAGTTFQVAEKNDTADSYKVKIEDKTPTTAVALFAEALVAANADTGATAARALDNTDGTNYKAQDIQITNTLDAISPTGVVLRFGPYMAIMAAGIALAVILVVRKRRREMED